jgi:hypothetical protein
LLVSVERGRECNRNAPAADATQGAEGEGAMLGDISAIISSSDICLQSAREIFLFEINCLVWETCEPSPSIQIGRRTEIVHIFQANWASGGMRIRYLTGAAISHSEGAQIKFRD